MNFKRMLKNPDGGAADVAALQNAAGIGADELGKEDGSEADEQSEDLA